MINWPSEQYLAKIYVSRSPYLSFRSECLSRCMTSNITPSTPNIPIWPISRALNWLKTSFCSFMRPKPGKVQSLSDISLESSHALVLLHRHTRIDRICFPYLWFISTPCFDFQDGRGEQSHPVSLKTGRTGIWAWVLHKMTQHIQNAWPKWYIPFAALDSYVTGTVGHHLNQV